MKLGESLGVMALTLGGPCLGLFALAACANQPPPTPRSAPEPHLLQGYWEAEGGSGRVSMTIEGDSLYFYDRPDFQYDTVFTLVPDTDPPELHATILDSPRTTDSEGEVVIAIYGFEGGGLDIAVVDKVEGVRPSFDEAVSRYHFEKVRARE